jgi:Tat protein secretion system quality control protein TatD with DNase activity
MHTAKYIASLREISLDELAERTTENVKRLFHGVS